MLGELLERELTRDDPEWAAASASLTDSEKLRIKHSRRQYKKNERGCRAVDQQRLSSTTQSVLMRKSFKTKEQDIRTQKKTVTFEAPDQGLIEVKSKISEQENVSGKRTVIRRWTRPDGQSFVRGN